MKTTKSVKTSTQIIYQFILKCRNCNKKFFSNNKFYKHIRSIHKIEKISQKILKITSINIIMLTIIIDFTNKAKNYRDFVFKSHRYATIKKSLIIKSAEQKLCMNSETFMFLMNRAFLTKQLFHIMKHKITFNIKIKNIKLAIYDSSKYVILDLYMSEKCQKNSVTVHFKAKFHIINKIKINMLINMNVMKSKRINLNFENKIMIIFTCRNIKMSINFHRKKISINRTIRAAIQITMLIEKIIVVSIRIKNTHLISKNRDYNFFSKMKRMLKFEKKYFVYVTNLNLVIIQIRNISDKSYIIFKNFKIEHLRDFDEKNCFMILFENNHLTMISDQIMNVKTTLKSKKFMKTTFFNEITMYGNETTMKKLQTITEETSKI